MMSPDANDVESERKRLARWTRRGALAAVLGFPTSVFMAILTAFAANPCGPFADSCDDYGKTGSGVEWFVAGAVFAQLMALAGVLVVVGTVIMRYRLRRRVAALGRP